MLRSPDLVTATALARLYGLQASWLRDEAFAGRLPALLAGEAVLFNRSSVERALAERAAQTAGRGARSPKGAR